jgi:hypothetical protein
MFLGDDAHPPKMLQVQGAAMAGMNPAAGLSPWTLFRRHDDRSYVPKRPSPAAPSVHASCRRPADISVGTSAPLAYPGRQALIVTAKTLTATAFHIQGPQYGKRA